MPVRELDESDRYLMIRFYEGEEQAFGLLTESWRARLLRFFRSLGFSSEDAEDLTQETMVRLYLTKESFSFDVSQPLSPFLYTIARNRAIAWWRHEKTIPDTINWFDLSAGEESLSALLRPRVAAPPVSKQMMTDLWVCIDNLSKKERLYLCLCGKHGLGDLNHNEIAVVLGKKNPAEITRISQRVFQKLRDGMVSLGYGRNLCLPVKEGKECLR
jgi:RNA polymerase sigma factor (sigma-70 family)